jgi:hypothetical protein
LAQVSFPKSTPEILGEATSSDKSRETFLAEATDEKVKIPIRVKKIVMFMTGVLFILGAFKFWKTRTWNL